MDGERFLVLTELTTSASDKIKGMVLKTTTLALILVLETLITSTTLSSAQISVRPNEDKFSETARDNADQRTVLIDKELRRSKTTNGQASITMVTAWA